MITTRVKIMIGVGILLIVVSSFFCIRFFAYHDQAAIELQHEDNQRLQNEAAATKWATQAHGNYPTMSPYLISPKSQKP